MHFDGPLPKMAVLASELAAGILVGVNFNHRRFRVGDNEDNARCTLAHFLVRNILSGRKFMGAPLCSRIGTRVLTFRIHDNAARLPDDDFTGSVIPAMDAVLVVSVG